MNCPICSRPAYVEKTMGNDRRRKCTGCGQRFTTTEVLKVDAERQAEAVRTVLDAAAKLKAA